jgi:hypothetical protein
MDGLHHPLENRVEQLAGLLGIAVGEELHRALEIGEQHGDLLALALERTLGREDLLGEVLGRVALRGSEARLWDNRRDNRVPAFGTKPRHRRQFGTAALAGARQRGATFLAELRTRAILMLAARAMHAETLISPP